MPVTPTNEVHGFGGGIAVGTDQTRSCTAHSATTFSFSAENTLPAPAACPPQFRACALSPLTLSDVIKTLPAATTRYVKSKSTTGRSQSGRRGH